MSDSLEQTNAARGGSDATSYGVDGATDGSNTPDITEQIICANEESNGAGDIDEQEPKNLEHTDAATEEGKILAGAVGGQQVNCDICENDKATMYCQKCPGYLCNQCYESHKASKMWKNHTYIDISVDQNFSVDLSSKQGDSSTETEVEIKCQEHMENLAVKICKSCRTAICTKCDDDHKTHDVVDLDPENSRNLQAICFDNVQIVLEYITKLETLSKDKGTEEDHEIALKHLKTIRDEFLQMSRKDFEEIIERFESDKNDTIDTHSKKLAGISDTLSEATCVLSKLHSVCTSNKVESLKNTLSYFYERIGEIMGSYDRLKGIKEKIPDISNEKDVQQRILSLLNMLTVGHCESSQYDKVTLDYTTGLYGTSHMLATSFPMCVYVSVYNLIYYNCITKERIKEKQIDTESLIDVTLLKNDKVILISKGKYLSTDTTLSSVFSSFTLPKYDMFCVWDETQLLFLLREEEWIFSLYNTNTTKQTRLFKTNEVKYNNFGPIRIQCTNNHILVFTAKQEHCNLYCFTKTGEFESTVDLSFIPDLYITSSSYVDQDENVMIGSPNGNVYLLDYKNLRYRKIVSVSGPVLKISISNNMLCVVYRYTDEDKKHICYLNAYTIGTK